MATEVKGGGRQVLRNIVCIMSMGFVFPHALMEEVDRKAALAAEELKVRTVGYAPRDASDDAEVSLTDVRTSSRQEAS